MDRTQTSVHVFQKHESRIEKLVHRKYNKILLQKWEQYEIYNFITIMQLPWFLKALCPLLKKTALIFYIYNNNYYKKK